MNRPLLLLGATFALTAEPTFARRPAGAQSDCLTLLASGKVLTRAEKERCLASEAAEPAPPPAPRPRPGPAPERERERDEDPEGR